MCRRRLPLDRAPVRVRVQRPERLGVLLETVVLERAVQLVAAGAVALVLELPVVLVVRLGLVVQLVAAVVELAALPESRARARARARVVWRERQPLPGARP